MAADVTYEEWRKYLLQIGWRSDLARQDAIDAQDEKYRRAQAYRDGKLDEYDAMYWPEKLAMRKSDRLLLKMLIVRSG